MKGQSRRLSLAPIATLLKTLGLQRHNQVLVGVLIVQIVVAALVFWPRTTGSAGALPLLPNLKADDVVGLQISEAGGKTIALQRIAGEWVLPDADNYPALDAKIAPVLEKLVALNTGRLVTRTDESHRRLQVAADDFLRRVEIETASGARHALLLGSSPAYGATHFRLEGQDETFIVSGLSTWELNSAASAWIDATYVNIPLEEVTSFSLENAQGSLKLTQREGVWSLEGLPAGETLDQNAALSLVRRAASLRLDRPLGTERRSEYGLAAPQARASLISQGKVIQVLVGAQSPEDSSYVVGATSSDYVVRAPEYAVQDLVTKSAQDLLMAPTPAAGATQSP